jgi:hypothetical protein
MPVVLVLVEPMPVDEVVLPGTEVVVDDELVEVVVVLVVLVVVVVGSVGAGLFSKIFVTVVPPPWWPNKSASGWPAINSTTVTKSNEKTNTATTTPATTGHRSPEPIGGATSASATSSRCGITGGAELSTGAVSSVGPALVDGGSPTVSDCVTPAALVPPSRLSNREPSGTRTTACFTAVRVLSIDWKSNAVPTVAATEPMATPTMVPFTPKMEAMTADRTAPPAEARICR